MDSQLEILEVLRRIEARLGQTEQQSSVQVATSTRGYDITVKAYANSPVSEAGTAAVEEYLRVRNELEQRLMDNITTEVSAGSAYWKTAR
jgi:hypothetical protein